ncbi:hypothetical protein [Prauserella sp. PE36]|uniref:hypothetical protein n=1 Tax=Prauserella sp. PE36 TaxID=1504709 RepID=UPI0018F60B8D|nr:hypothetical protein [Prauserella sp. PE36]
MALSLLILERMSSGLGVTGIVVAEIVPVLALHPLAGVLVDRLSPVRIMVVADFARTLLAVLLPLESGSVLGVYSVAFAISAASSFFNPAAGAVPPAVVREKK